MDPNPERFRSPVLDGAHRSEPPRHVIDLVPYGILVANADATATFANTAWTDLPGQADGAWRGRGWLEVLEVGERPARQAALMTAMVAGRRYEADWTTPTRAQRNRTLRVQAVPSVRGRTLEGFVVVAVDVSADRALRLHLLDQATHDPLTGLYNRGQFRDFVRHALNRRRRSPSGVAAVLFVDVDDLKSINDVHGHDAGDRALCDVAARLTASVRPADIVARYGGDEFAVLCEELADRAEADAIAERIRASGTETSPGVSVGVAVAVDPDTDPASMVAEADRAMYRAKRAKADATHVATLVAAGAIGEAGADRLTTHDDIDLRTRTDEIDLLAVAAHELRTPLATIAGFAATLRSLHDRMRPTDIDAAFAILDRQAERLGAMLDQLLDLGRYHHGSTGSTLVDVADVVSDALEDAPPPDGITVAVSPDPTSPLLVTGERSTVTRVLVNLLTNAYRYGGPQIEITSHNGGADVTVSVEDNGWGVPRVMAESVFAPFVRAEPTAGDSTDGAGLGLALAREIAESLGGHLRYEHVEPHGARFVLTLPRVVSTDDQEGPVEKQPTARA